MEMRIMDKNSLKNDEEKLNQITSKALKELTSMEKESKTTKTFHNVDELMEDLSN